jgi:Holliday junction resolvase RusA-like endonuclease
MHYLGPSMYIFEIHGDPIPQKQTQFLRKTGIAYDPSSKDRQKIQWQAKPYAPSEPIIGPVSVDLVFYFEPPKSTSSVKRRQMLNHVIHHIKRPDADNCAYLVTNALKGIFYKDDSQIIDLNIHKRYGLLAKTVVKITVLEEIAPTRGEECE